MTDTIMTGRSASAMRLVALSMRTDDANAPWLMKAGISMLRNDRQGVSSALSEMHEIDVDHAPIMGVTAQALVQDMQMFARGMEGAFRMRPALNPADPDFANSFGRLQQWNASQTMADPEEDLDRTMEMA